MKRKSTAVKRPPTKRFKYDNSTNELSYLRRRQQQFESDMRLAIFESPKIQIQNCNQETGMLIITNEQNDYQEFNVRLSRMYNKQWINSNIADYKYKIDQKIVEIFSDIHFIMLFFILAFAFSKLSQFKIFMIITEIIHVSSNIIVGIMFFDSCVLCYNLIVITHLYYKLNHVK